MDHAHHDMSGMTASPTSSIISSAMSMIASATTSASSGHDMSMADASTDSTSGMNMMMMSMGTFHWGSTGDGIWLDSWVPNSEGAYIGACFGLFFVSILSRSLPALEAYFMRWRLMRDNKIETNVLTAQPITKKDIEKSSSEDSSSQSFNPAAYPNPLNVPAVPPFSWTTDPIRSFITTVASFVSYLLMMVVMTGNGGYLLVIVLGVFFGELAFGRFKALGGFLDDHSH